MRLFEQTIEVLQVPIFGIDGVVIGNIVAEVSIRGRHDGREPDAVDPKVLEIIEALDNAVQVADAVGVGVLEGTRVNLIDNAVFPPLLLLFHCCLLWNRRLPVVK